MGAIFTEEICKCTLQAESASPRQSKSLIFEESGGDLGGGRSNLGNISVCFERDDCKNVVNFLGEEKCTPDKILATSMIDCVSHSMDRVQESLAKTAKPAVTA